MTNYQKWVTVEHRRLELFAVRDDESLDLKTRSMAGMALKELERMSKILWKATGRKR